VGREGGMEEKGEGQAERGKSWREGITFCIPERDK
jgi:hypothetical protein